MNVSTEETYIAGTYNRYHIKVSHAKGIYVWDKDGKSYIDTFMGIGVLLFGHNHEKIIYAMKRKMEKYVHLSNFFLDEDALFVAQRLVEETGRYGKVFFTNSGAESTECALKVVRKVKKTGKILSFVRNFHGRTLSALSVTGFENIRSQFVNDENVVFLPYDYETVKRFLEEEKHIAAVFLEVVHGSGGLDVIPQEIVQLVSDYKKEHSYLIITDEVQSGLGRTGKFYAYQHFSIQPDIVTVAKGIGGGLPLGACIMLEEYADVFKTGEHGSTFAPNPLALAAGRAVLEMIDEHLLNHVVKTGKYFEERFSNLGSVLGMGLMRGLKPKLSVDSKWIERFINQGLLVNILANGVVRFLLPLNITREQIDEVYKRFCEVVEC
jgi:acetylornithine/succinyldiaminopimelate/putrescine aminotransferase